MISELLCDNFSCVKFDYDGIIVSKMNTITKNNLKINSNLFEFINKEVIPGTEIIPDEFWNKFSKIVHELSPINKDLLNKREEIQKKIDEWHLSKKGAILNYGEYFNFLKSINYILSEGDNFEIKTENVDNEICSIAGPQLVVPVDNARYALNAANARWGSLYDALYGTDAISGNRGKEYNEERGYTVINYVRDFLDKTIPISKMKWHQITKFKIEDNKLVLFIMNEKYYLKKNDQFIGFQGEKDNPKSILLKNNNLHIDIVIDPNSKVGKMDSANISDVIVESAISTIVDNEDSVAAVDAEDKIKCYRNWLGLMKGSLKVEIEKFMKV